MKITTALNGALLCGAAVGTSAMGACLSAEAEANNAQNKANAAPAAAPALAGRSRPAGTKTGSGWTWPPPA
ncbi:hypothetical protein LP420_12680 [Massilia sp. B-10]|nr:hypothetical protein LP420_12680 [Massilia sp. B-10]